METTVIIPTMYKIPSITDYNIRTLLKQKCKVIIIDNTSNNQLKKWEGTKNIKVNYFPSNIGVNPAWNIGVLSCGTKYYLLLNDDCMIWNNVIEHSEKILEDNKIGLVTYKTLEDINSNIYESIYINQNRSWGLVDLVENERIGWFIFGRSKEYPEIPKSLKIFYGDDFIYKCIRNKDLRTVIDINNVIFHKTSSTTNGLKDVNTILEQEKFHYISLTKNIQIKKPIIESLNTQKEIFEKKVYNLETSSKILIDSILTKKKLSYIRLGNIEGDYLSLGFLLNKNINILNHLWACGINKNNIPSQYLLIDAIKKTDIIGVQEPWFIENYHLWGSIYKSLVNYNIINQKEWHSVHSIYKITADGELFKALENKRVIIIGAKSKIFADYFWKLPALRELYPELNLDKLNIVKCIETVDCPNNIMDYSERYLNEIQKTYGEADTYIMSCGIFPKFVAWRIAEESNTQVLDVGNIFESIMNLANKRPYMQKFLNFEHPNYKFIIGQHMEIRNIIRK